jgi:serine/threonine protein kinase
VYLGEAKKGKKLVAIKEVSKLEENEIACLMNSESPFIIKLYEFWSVEKHSYIALELCDGNLRESLENIKIYEKIEYFEQIVEGMNYLNKKNIIHRDLKFENILLKNHTVKISDFGFAKPIGSQLAVLSEKCGTPYTMAP